jgi:hypothetical protein
MSITKIIKLTQREILKKERGANAGGSRIRRQTILKAKLLSLPE